MADKLPIPRFYLYGEPHRAAESRFVHVEDLDDRSRPSEWTIRPHAHAELNHIFHVQSGGGAMRADNNHLTFDASCLILVPAGIVHGFSWRGEPVGSVITVSTSYLHHIGECDAGLRRLFVAAKVCALDDPESQAFASKSNELMVELGWAAPGHRAAIEAGLLGLLVRTLRARGATEPVHHLAAGHQVALVARLRERIETHFRLREPAAIYAQKLGTSPTRLRSACAAVAGQPPMEIRDQRAMLEAQRTLLYSNLTVAEIADALGFPDPAYFSRFFAKRMGMSPRHYRDQHLLGSGANG